MGTDHAETSDLSERECWERLRSEAYGRLAVVGPDGPMVYPINAIVDHGSIVFRTTEGTKLDAMRIDPRVAFEVDGWDPADSMAWSVIVTGSAKEITGMHEGLDVIELGVTPWQAGPKPTFIRIITGAIAGRIFRRTDGRD
jgi:nitroimidazol reductase NimA-like FMN-containing flavoprotein (pyridoxamine 5'-phosphate oxidase superfamily)